MGWNRWAPLGTHAAAPTAPNGYVVTVHQQATAVAVGGGTAIATCMVTIYIG